MSVKVFVVDGVIGAGKSSLIQKCLIPELEKRNMQVILVKEPVDSWVEDGCLQEFYKDPTRRSFQFQIRVFHDRVMEARTQYKYYMDNLYQNKKQTVFILERSIFTDVLFSNMLLSTEQLDSSEYRDYAKLWDMWVELMPFKPDLFIYLKPDIDIVMNRLKARARDGENSISYKYQQALEEEHDKFFMKTYIDIKKHRFDVSGNVHPRKSHNVPSLLIHSDLANEDFRENNEIKIRIMNMLDQYLYE
jgi:deoxyadenosine/deoxycytidine kinase